MDADAHSRAAHAANRSQPRPAAPQRSAGPAHEPAEKAWGGH